MEYIERIYKDNKEILDFLESNNEISFRSDLDSKLKKIILLSSASYYEKLVTSLLEDFAAKVTRNNVKLISFVKCKGISRQYHTLFDWKAANINSFLGLFGDDFKVEMKKEINDNEELKSSVQSFLLIGSERNKLVHIDFATFSLDYTSDEIYKHYKNGLKVISFLRDKFLE